MQLHSSGTKKCFQAVDFTSKLWGGIFSIYSTVVNFYKPFFKDEAAFPECGMHVLQLLQLAANCGFDVSQGLDEIFHPTPGTESTAEQISELSQFCGIDVNQLMEPTKVQGIAGFLFGVPANTSNNRSKRSVPGATGIEQLPKKPRLGSY